MKKISLKKAGAILLSAIVLFGACFFPKISLAQTANDPFADDESMVLIASVNVYRVKVLSQEGNELSISFDIANEQGNQPDVKYGVQLITIDDEDNATVVDEKVYPEVLNLTAKQRINKVVSYQAPEYLSGKYMVRVISRNENGLDLGIMTGDEVTLDGTNQYVDINPENCYLTIPGEEDTQYDLEQGVDIAMGETLIAHCKVLSKMDKAVDLVGEMKTYRRDTFGKLQSVEQTEPFHFEKGAQKEILFSLPVMENPQAYDVVMRLMDKEKYVSNFVRLHYVLQGNSATVQNVVLDKNSYQPGDQAKVQFVWSGSADTFSGARGQGNKIADLTLNIVMRNGQGQDCTKPMEKDLSQKEQTEIISLNMPVISSCSNPTISATLKDKEGEILDDTFVQSGNPSNQVSIPTDDFRRHSVWPIMGLLLIGALIITLIIIVTKFLKSKVVVFIIMTGVGVSLLLTNGHAVQANTYSANVSDGDMTVTYNLNDREYQPNETVTANVTYHASVCKNKPNFTLYMGWHFTDQTDYDQDLRNDDQILFKTCGNYTGEHHKYVSCNIFNRKTKIAPSTLGTYGARFHFATTQDEDCYKGARTLATYPNNCWNHMAHRYRTIWFNVVAPKVCTGADPANATMCANDDQGLLVDTPKKLVSTCTLATKCEFKCDAGYHKSGTVCVPDTNTCSGTLPMNSVKCAGTQETGLIVPESWHFANPCSGSGSECEFTCAAGYSYNGSSCVAGPSVCGGTLPANADKCAGTQETGLTVPASWHYTNSCSGPSGECEFQCKSGFSYSSAGNCSKMMQEVLP